MIKDKWLKAGAAAAMSVAVLSGCGNSDEPQMKQENQVPGEEQEDNVDRVPIEDEDDPDESDEETEKDATTDSMDDDDTDVDED